MIMDPGTVFRSLRAGARILGLVILVNVAVALFAPASAILLILVLTLLSSLPPASDDEMIALLTERRPAFEALVRRAQGEVATDGSATGNYTEDMRRLSDATGGFTIGRVETDWFELHSRGGLSGREWKVFIYYFTPVRPLPMAVDLHGDDAADVARALLLTTMPRVNDLDVLRRYSDFDAIWEAERPIDEHWSLRLTHIR